MQPNVDLLKRATSPRIPYTKNTEWRLESLSEYVSSRTDYVTS
jgi:hypothetical protein